MPHGLVTTSSSRPSPSISIAGPNLLSRVFRFQPPRFEPFCWARSEVSAPSRRASTPMPQSLVTMSPCLPAPSTSPVAANALRAASTVHCPAEAPLATNAFWARLVPESPSTTTPCGPEMTSSARPSPSRSAAASIRSVAVSSVHDPKTVPFGAIAMDTKEVPSNRRMPRPHGLVITSSARPSPSKSPTAGIQLSPVLSSHSPRRVPFGERVNDVKAPPRRPSRPMAQGLVTTISARPSPSASAACRNWLFEVSTTQSPSPVPFCAIALVDVAPPANAAMPMPHGLDMSASCRPSASKSPTSCTRFAAVSSSHSPMWLPF